MGWVGLGGGVRPDNDLRSFVNKQTILVKGFSDIRAQRGGERGSLCRRGGGGGRVGVRERGKYTLTPSQVKEVFSICR